jgi:hypothetical protein
VPAGIREPLPSPAPLSDAAREATPDLCRNRVRVLDPTGGALHPCHPARARELVRRGRAEWVAGARRTLRLLATPGGTE